MKKNMCNNPLDLKFTTEFQQPPHADYQSSSFLKVLVNKPWGISLYAYIQAQGEHYIYYSEALNCAKNTGRKKSLSVDFYKHYIKHSQFYQREEQYRADEIKTTSDLYFYLIRIFAHEFKELISYTQVSSNPQLFHIVPL